MDFATDPNMTSMLAPAQTEVEYVARALARQNFLLIAPGGPSRPDLRWVANEVEVGWPQFRLQAEVAINAIDEWHNKRADG